MSDNIPVKDQQQAVEIEGSPIEGSPIEVIPIVEHQRVPHGDAEQGKGFGASTQPPIVPSVEATKGNEGESRLLSGHCQPAVPVPRNDISDFNYQKDERSGSILPSTVPSDDELPSFSPSHHQDQDFGVAETDLRREENRPKWSSLDQLFAEPSPTEIARHINEVFSLIKEAMCKFPNALGLVTAFTNSSSPLVEDSLQNVEQSSKNVTAAMDQYGYVTCIFSECTKAKMLAIFEVLTSRLNYPTSYKMLLIHILGHGQKDFIGLRDGFLSKNRLKQFFLNPASSVLSTLPKVIFFDSCRTNFGGSPPENDLRAIENLLVIHSTGLGRCAYLVNAEGMGVATSEFVKLLRQKESCSFGDLLAELIRTVKERYRNIKLKHPNLEGEDFDTLWPEYHSTLDTFPNLFEDKMTGMRPFRYTLTKDHSCDKYILSFKGSPHVNHYKFKTYYVSMLSHNSIEWTKMRDIEETVLELSFEEIDGVKFQVGATYEEEDGIPVDVIGTDSPAFFRSNNVDPVKVFTCGRGDSYIFWQECPNMFLYKDFHHNCSAKIWRHPLSSNQNWEEVKSIPCSTQSTFMISIQPYQPESHSFAVSYDVGTVSGNMVPAEEYHHGQNQACLLEDSHIARSNDEVTISWGISPRSQLLLESTLYFNIYSRSNQHQADDVDQQWESFKENIPDDQRELVISREEANNKEFKVELHVTTHGSHWSESAIASNRKHHPTQLKYKVSCCFLFVFILLFVLCLFLGIQLSYGFNNSSRTSTYLGLASDVIDCEDINSLQHLLYEKLSVTQMSNSYEKDNPQLQISVLSIPCSNIIYHNLQRYGESIREIKHSNESGPSLVPDDYYNRPWYLRNGSNITIKVTMSYNKEEDERPLKVMLYLFDNEKGVESFMSDTENIPHYEDKIDVLNSGKDAFTFTISESSYYYIVADIRTNYNINFFTEMTFNILYIDDDDYPNARKWHIGSNGGTAHIPIDAHQRNLTVCAISPLPSNSLDSHTTHIQIKYFPRVSAIVVLFIIVLISSVALCALFLIFILCIWKFFKHYFSKSKTVQKDEALQPLLRDDHLP